MRKAYDGKLNELSALVASAGELCLDGIKSALKGFFDNDRDEAQRAAELFAENEEKESEIESLCIKLYMKQQPVADDLRKISASLKMVTDVKRISNIAADMADIILKASNVNRGDFDLTNMRELAECAVKMTENSLKAFIDGDSNKAKEVTAEDDKADRLFEAVKKDITEAIKKDTLKEEAADVLLAAKYMEKVGDHAVNIARWAEFCSEK